MPAYFREEEAARGEMEGAQQLLRVCLEPPSPGIAAAVQDSGAIGPLLERLQDAYADIWQLHFMSGLGKLQVQCADMSCTNEEAHDSSVRHRNVAVCRKCCNSLLHIHPATLS
jgi:hypothetical protein